MRAIAGSERPSFSFVNRTAILGFRCARQKPYTQKPYMSRQIGHVLDFWEFPFVHFQGFGTFVGAIGWHSQHWVAQPALRGTDTTQC